MTKTIIVGAPSGRNCQLNLGWSWGRRIGAASGDGSAI